jgi:hypothetical protein
MPSTARQLRQPPTIGAIGRVPYFADIASCELVSTILLSLPNLNVVATVKGIITSAFGSIILTYYSSLA